MYEEQLPIHKLGFDMQNLYYTTVSNSLSGIQVHRYPTFGLPVIIKDIGLMGKHNNYYKFFSTQDIL